MDSESQRSRTAAKSGSFDRLAGRLAITFEVLQEQMEALRDIITATIPYASALDERDIRFAGIRKVIPQIPPKDLKAVRSLIADVIEERLPAHDLLRKILEDYEGQEWSYELTIAMYTTLTRQRRLPMLQSSLLTTAVASYEAAVANVATEFFNYRPEALEANSRDREKEFSLRELKQFDSISDAVDFTISRRVENLMFGGLSDWRRFFKEALKLDMEDLAIDWPGLQEILQRRHAIVHNSGRASRRYVSQVKQTSPDSKISEGDRLQCDQDYLEHAIDHLLVAGVLLIMAIAVKFSAHSDIVPLFNGLAYSLLKSGRMAATTRLCDFGMDMPIDQDTVLVFKVNRALAIKASSGISAIAEDIGAWDVSALSAQFQLAKASILGDMDEAFPLLVRLVEHDEIDIENLLEWPLLAEMRKDRRFTALIMPKLDEAPLDILDTEFFVLNPRTRILHKPTCRSAKSGNRIHIDSPDAQAAHRCRICWP